MTQVLLYQHAEQPSLKRLLAKYKLSINLVNDEKIPGSYWGDSEAGIINSQLYVRKDTPIHSIMHEACHYICMDKTRRIALNTNAQGDYDEENAVCYLQILLAEFITSYSSEKMCQDMDNWGYTFRLGSAKKWFESDAEDALNWLIKHNIVFKNKQVTWQLACQLL